jgi:hypothetical protein
MFIDFMNAAGDHPVIMNYQAIPGWMLVRPKPENPTHEISSLFRDPSGLELAQYFARIVEWYTKGGFTDELGNKHVSGHQFRINYWEVLNEPDHESINMSVELYTKVYDAVVEEIRKVNPEMKFMGMSMANLPKARQWTEYFLDSSNHKPGIPLDMVSYHMYAVLPYDKLGIENYPHTIFSQADNHLETIRVADSIRQALSPVTWVDINESGILLRDVPRGWGRMNGDSIPGLFWNLSAAYYAYIYAGVTRLGTEIVGNSTLWSDPQDWPEVSVLEWKTGIPNARYHVLKMIRDHFGPGDRIVGTSVTDEQVFAQGFVTSKGERKLLLINKGSNEISVAVTDIKGGKTYYVGPSTGLNPPQEIGLQDGIINLESFGVAIVMLPN